MRFCLFVVNNKSYYLHFAYGFFPLLSCHLWPSHTPFFSESNHVDQCTRWPSDTHIAHGTWHHTSPLSFSLSCAVVAWEREYVVKIYTLRKRRKNAFFSFLFFLREKNGIYKRRYIRIDTTLANFLVLITQNILVLGVLVTLLQAAKGALVKLFLCLTFCAWLVINIIILIRFVSAYVTLLLHAAKCETMYGQWDEYI